MPLEGGEFTAKDFRTWAGSLNILWAFKSIGESMDSTEGKKKIVEALDVVSKKLGNTRTVCQKVLCASGSDQSCMKKTVCRNT